jgi:hypothetical protein
MAKTALITGATSGIGASFARFLAHQGYDLILVARDESRLTQSARDLSVEFGVKCEILPADLSTDAGTSRVAVRAADTNSPINVLINNAGFAIKESFLKTEVTAELQLLDVLARTPMRLMHSVLPGMKDRNEGIVINVSSVAGWLAGGSYSAAKAYLTVLSESLHTELAGTNVKVLALCPGFTHTEFHQRAKMRMAGLPNFMWLTADDVVAKAWSDAKAGKAISVPGKQYMFLTAIARIGPRPLVRKLGIKIRIRQRSK